MKNILYQESIVEIKHLFRIMKTTVLALFIFAGTAFATESYSQVMKVTVVADKISTGKVINEIEKQTDYLFVYNVNEINLKRPVQVNAENKSVAEVLNQLFEGTNIYYAMEGKNIMLMSRTKNSASVQQSGNKVRGVVQDTNGEPIIGANITVKGQSIGTITDIDGQFSIDAPSNAVLQISFIGYVSQEVKADNKKILSVILKEDSKMLDEVVVVGYGTMRKKDVTGSVIQIKPASIANEAPKTIQDVLRGTPGLKVGADNSAKGGGSLEIRGNRSMSEISSSNPLIILDDMPFYGELSEINPEDIGQIDILKDASSAAVYGARAANGVVIITTKKGKQGKPIINFSTKIGFVTKTNYKEVYDGDGYMRFREDWNKTPTYGFNSETGKYEAYQTGTTKPGFYDHPDRLPTGVALADWRKYDTNAEGITDLEIYANRLLSQSDPLIINNFLAGRTFDWYDHAFQTGFNQDYNASISGAGEKMNYYMSLGYIRNEGVTPGDEYHAVRANMKLSANITNWLEVSGNVNFQNRSDGSQTLDESGTLNNSPFGNYRDENGNLAVYPMGVRKGYNYDYNRQYEELERGTTVLNSIFTAKIKLPFNINYSFNASPRFSWYYNRYFQSAEHADWKPENVGANRDDSRSFNWSINNTINWEYTFTKKHRVNLTLVQEAEKHQSWGTNVAARHLLPTDALGFHYINVANKLASNFTSSDSYQTAVGLLGRLFYSYDDRYMLTASIRRDGYSAFGENKPYATFPSIATAWTFTNEKFFNWQFMSTGKLRLSWGLNGNRAITNPYLALASLDIGNSLFGVLDSSGNLKEMEYLKIGRMASPNLKWEKSEAWNFGLDFGFLNDRISGSLEGYIIRTQDMILNRQLPQFSGFSEIATNLGEVQNSGFEITVNSQNIKNKNFEWDTSFNLSYNKNEIKHIYYDYEDVLDANGNVIGSKEKDEYGKWWIGRPISAIWNYRVIGIWQPNEIEEAAKVGQKPGDPKVANNYTEDDKINADGSRTPVYNDKDKEFLGQSSSPAVWQIRNSFKIYKNFDFSFNLYSCWGAKYLDTTYLNQEMASAVDHGFNITKREYWTPDNLTNEYARLGSKGPTGVNSPGKLIDRSFIRLENISVAYTFPKTIITKWGINGLKLFGTVRNVGIIWSKHKYKLGDIETMGRANRTYSLGLNVTL